MESKGFQNIRILSPYRVKYFKIDSRFTFTELSGAIVSSFESISIKNQTKNRSK